MAYYSAEEMKSVLAEYPQYREKLYCRGFLLTDRADLKPDEYPFYGNWRTLDIAPDGEAPLYLLTHFQTAAYTVTVSGITHFLVGHAYNPYSMEYREADILRHAATSLQECEAAYWQYEGDLTGVFCIGFVRGGQVVFSTDCTGMQLVYYGTAAGHFFLTSHSKLVADLCGLVQDDYITRLVNSRFYHYWGTFLPGDLSPYQELKRVVPNFSYGYDRRERSFSFHRFFPTQKIEEVSEDAYPGVLREVSDTLERTMQLIAQKWPDRRAAISVTGGRDSTTTLASASKLYDKFGYFSYISNPAEKVDADAATIICRKLGLPHTVYTIPEESELYTDIDVIRKILECNAGCIGHNNRNDVKKRIYLHQIHDFDVEVKSWVDEISRCEAQNKYNTERFPKKPSVGYYRCMWKVIVHPRLIRESNRVFRSFLQTYYSEESLSRLFWTDYFFWEFAWGAGEGCFLTSEHKFSSDITIPYNHRRLLATMLTAPYRKRLHSEIQMDTIRRFDKRIEDADAHVKDAAHTDFWSFIIRTYLRIFSKF